MNTAEKINWNKSSSSKYGWKPDWFGAIGFDEDLINKVISFQKELGLDADGLVGSGTHRAICTWVEFNKNSNDDHNTSEYIVCSGNRVKIDWPKVVTMTNKGALTVNSNSYKVTPDRKPNLFIVHWDACLNSTSCASVLKERGLSVHFCIDNDGTIYQLVDTANIAYHASGINQASIGVEISNAFYTKYQSYYLKNGFGARPVLKNTKVHAGKIDEHMMFYPVQEQALSALIKAVCGAYGIPLAVPKLNGSYATGEHQEVASGKFKGVACHFHATSRKIDCAGLDLEKIIK